MRATVGASRPFPLGGVLPRMNLIDYTPLIGPLVSIATCVVIVLVGGWRHKASEEAAQKRHRATQAWPIYHQLGELFEARMSYLKRGCNGGYPLRPPLELPLVGDPHLDGLFEGVREDLLEFDAAIVAYQSMAQRHRLNPDQIGAYPRIVGRLAEIRGILRNWG